MQHHQVLLHSLIPSICHFQIRCAKEGVKIHMNFKISHAYFWKAFFFVFFPLLLIRLLLFSFHVSVLCYLTSSIFPPAKCPQLSMTIVMFENCIARCSRTRFIEVSVRNCRPEIVYSSYFDKPLIFAEQYKAVKDKKHLIL